MDQRHQEYCEYYKARLSKFAGNPLFPNSEAAEQAMYQAISEAASLEEFGQKMLAAHLHVNCAVAFLRDKCIAYTKLYEDLEETVRAKPYREILANLDSTEYTDAVELTSMASDILTKWQIPISMDEILRTTFWSDWIVLESLEVHQTADVPDSWRKERDAWIEKKHQEGRQDWQEHELAEARKFDPDYQPNWEMQWETRHRRRYPISDEVLKERLAQYRKYVGDE